MYRIALALFLAHGIGRPLPLPRSASYVARTLNGRTLPADLRLPTTAGDFRLFRLEQAVLRLDGEGRFTLYFRYYHQLVRKGARPVATPVLAEAQAGTYNLMAKQLTLVPAKIKGARPRPTILATFSGEEIKAFYVLQNGSTREPVTLVLRRDASYW